MVWAADLKKKIKTNSCINTCSIFNERKQNVTETLSHNSDM